MYKLTLGIQNTSYAISEYFAVRSSIQFNVVRSGLTRIVPSRPYDMGITITPNQDFSGMVTERVYLSNQFSMPQDSGATLIKGAHQEELEWHVKWQKENGIVWVMNMKHRLPAQPSTILGHCG